MRHVKTSDMICKAKGRGKTRKVDVSSKSTIDLKT